MAKFGQKQVFDYYGMKTEYIPHGTEPNRFYRLSDQEREILRSKWGLNNKFVIGVVARNQGRKMMDRTLKTMFLLKDKIPEAVLLLHMDVTDPAQAWDIRSLIQRYNLENRVKFTGMTALKGFDWNQMNEIYNLMDVFFLSTSGEGFGIPIIESMACEVPVVATDYTTTPELVIANKTGFGAKLAGTDSVDMFSMHSKIYDDTMINGTLTGSWEVERGLIDCKDAADKIISLYKDSELRKEFGKNGRKAVLKEYDFENVVGPAWEKILQ
jgi:glycosyltransferase involved in cell wall biosynthesis